MIPSRPACLACGADTSSAPRLRPTEQQWLVRCRRCGAQWLEGNQLRETAAYEYENYSNDVIGRQYFAHRARRFARYLKAIASPPGLVLDVGCGAGEFLQAAHDLGWKAVGVELTGKGAALARRVSRLPVVAGNLIHSPFRAATFDVITLWGVLEHVVSAPRLLEAIAQALRPGGLLLLETPNPDGAFIRIGRLLHRTSGGRAERLLRETMGAGHVVWYTVAALRQALAPLGIDVVHAQGSRNWTRILVHRFKQNSFPVRAVLSAGTAALNFLGPFVGLPNQIVVAGRKR